MRTISETFAINETKAFSIPGSYFRLLSTVGPVSVSFFRGGANLGDNALAVESGFFALPDGGFDRVDVTSPTAQTVKFALTRGRGGYDRTVGDVQILNTANVKTVLGTTITNTAAVTVGVAETALVAADPARRGLRVLNNGTADVWLGGAGVTTVNGCIKLAPGDLWSEDDAPGAAWFGISGAAGQNVRVQVIA